VAASHATLAVEPTAPKWASEEREAAEARAAQERDIERRRQAGWG